MIFLYRFDVLQLDGVISNNDPAYLIPAELLTRTRTVYALTNSGTPVFGDDQPAPLFLPNNVPDDYVSRPLPFEPAAIEHDGIRSDGERNAGQLKVSMPSEHPLGQLYALDSPAVQTWLTLYQFDNTVPTEQPLVIWVGQVVNAEYDETRVKFTLDHLQKVLVRPGLTAKHPRACGHLLFDKATCAVKADALAADGYWKFREDGTVASVSADGLVVTIPEAANKPDGWFAHGYLTIGGQYTELSGDADHIPRADVAAKPLQAGMQVFAGYRRSVLSHQGGTLRLVTPLPPGDYALAGRSRVSLYAGCDGALATCKAKFQNVPRFGGYPYIPIKNPFEVGLKNAAGSTGSAGDNTGFGAFLLNLTQH